MVTCTGAVGAVVTLADVHRALAEPDRDNTKHLVICDLGLPRDIDPAVAGLPGVTVLDMETLQRDPAAGAAASDADAARTIVAGELATYLAGQRLAEVTPTVTALRQRAADVVEAELMRLDSRLPGLDDPQRDEVARTVRRVVDKLLHAPTVRVKQLASAPGATPTQQRCANSSNSAPDLPRPWPHPPIWWTATALEGPAGMSVTTLDREPAADRHSRKSSRDHAGRHRARCPHCSGTSAELVIIKTKGDQSTDPVQKIGVGVFTAELREALLDNRVDVAVHSYKDLPTAQDPRFVIAAIPPREDPRDALVARDGLVLGELPAGSKVGTSAPRRVSQLKALGLGLDIVPLRGNLQRRLGKVESGELDAVILARAGLSRIGLLDLITENIEPVQMLPAPAQGALAVECLSANTELAAILAEHDDAGTRAAVTAERALLAELEAGCTAPVGAIAEIVESLDDDGRIFDELSVRGCAAAIDGSDVIRTGAVGAPDKAEELGRAVARELLELGARELMNVTTGEAADV
ncbi:hypothetical protein GCM10020255_061780 [Rhodococcus baikonurensis]